MKTELIEIIRKRKGLSQREVAESIGITTTGYQKLVRVGDMKVSTLEKLCIAFNVNIITFFGTGDIKESETFNNDQTANLELLNAYREIARLQNELAAYKDINHPFKKN